MEMKNLLVAQSGGPTAAINATVAGILEAAYINTSMDKVYGGINGIEGILQEKLVDMKAHIYNNETMQLLYQTPAAALGSCRFKLADYIKDESQYEKLVEIFRKYNIHYFIYVGGNDSMDTVDKLSRYLSEKGISDIQVMGAPKTIDNDLAETDHCPGYGSAAKYIATSVAEIQRDCSVYDMKSVTIVEIMGRNTGWLTAASALARENGGKGPSLIYLCEYAFDEEKFISDVTKKIDVEGSIVIAVSEGLKDVQGRYLSESVQTGSADVFGHKYIAGTGRVLEGIIRDKIGCKTRTIELNLMQRAASHLASDTDLFESSMLGKKAVQALVEGKSGEMVTIVRKSTKPYMTDFSSVSANKVANHEKVVPLEWIDYDHADVTEDMLQYMRPLIQGETNIVYKNGIPKHIKLY